MLKTETVGNFRPERGTEDWPVVGTKRLNCRLEMGCRKLSYYEEEALEVTALFSQKGVGKNGDAPKKRVSYYPGGSIMPGHSFNAGSHRFGFQGQEKDDEIKGNGNSVNYKYRMHDPRIGRFFAVDPLTAEYPFYSPYQFSGNRLIDMMELEGLEPTASGSYAGQGAQAPIRDEGDAIQPGSEGTRWIWNNNAWGQTNTAVTNTELNTLFPSADPANLREVETAINLNGKDFGITNMNQVAHFLAQTGHESAGFSRGGLTESTYYSSLTTVGNAFGTSSSVYAKAAAHPGRYLRNSANFANMAYAGKIGNGPESSGDGYRFRGRGFIQLTGRGNYSSFTTAYNSIYGTAEDFTRTPAKLATDRKIAVVSSMWYFQQHSLPRVNSGASFRDVTRTVNSRLNGLTDRRNIFNNATNLFK